MISSKRKLQIVFAVLALMWMAIIFRFSAQPGEESHEISQLVVALVTKVVQGLNSIGFRTNLENVDMNLMDYIIRKIAHVTEYAILAVFISGSVLLGSIKKNIGAIIAVAIGILYAASDELHQYFVPGRLGCFRDVCIDSIGVIIGVVCFVICMTVLERIIKRRNR